MARLPDFTSLGERPTPQPSMGVASYQPRRDGLGEDIAAAGGELQQASAIIAQTNRRQDMIAAEAALNKLQQQRVSLEYEKDGFRSVKEGGVVGQKFVDGYMERLDNATKLIEEGLLNDQQRAIFKQRAPVVSLQYRSSLLQHQAQQTEVFNDATERSTLDLQIQSIAMQPTNDIALQTGLVRIDATIDQMGQRKGLPSEQVASLKTKYRDAAYSSRILSNLVGIPGVVDANPYVARDMLEKNREKLLPETVLKLSQDTTTAIRMLENAQRIDQDKRLKEAEREFEALQKFSLTGALPDEGYQAQVRTKTAGTPYAESADLLIKKATIGAMHGSRSVPNQQQTIRQMEAIAAAKGTSPEAEQVLQAARQITSHQEAAYKENPWAAGARFQRLPSIQDAPLPQAEATPNYVKQVLPLMDAVETAGGMSVSPLQPNQARVFSEQLAKLPPGPRAEVLGQTGEVLNAGRIQALAEQLDKSNKPLALALKIGAGRTSLDRSMSETLLRGADAIKDKTVKKDDAALTGWRQEIATMVRGTIGDQKAEDDAIDAAWYVRAGMDEPGYPGKVSAETAIALVVGRPYERGGVKTLLPRGMTEDDFVEKVRQYTPERLTQMIPAGTVYIRGQKRTIPQLSSALPGMGLKRNPAGGYTPVSGGAFVTLDEAGTIPLSLEVK